MTQTQAEIQSDRDASKAEHERLLKAVQEKPISQVFIEEAEREIAKLEISPDTKAGALLKDYLITSYEKTHHSLCKSMAKASYMAGTTEGMAVGCIRGTNGRWLNETQIQPLSTTKQSISQMFHDAAHDTVSRVPELDMNSDHADDLVTGLMNRFENHFYAQIKASEQSGQSLDPHETAQSVVELICNDYE
jgi:hypothetical protein